MGFYGFASWFIGGMLIVASLQVLFSNVFITSFVAGAMMGFLGARE